MGSRRGRWAPVSSSLLVPLLLLGGCGDGPAPDAPVDAADDVAPVDSGQVAVTTSAGLTAEQVAWLQQVDDDDLAALDVALVDDPGAGPEVASRGPAAAPTEESPRPIDRSTPTALLGSALDALAAADVAALARLSASREERPTLDEDDAADAERRFLAAAVRPYWERIASAVRAGEVTLRPGHAPDEALLEVRVGGAAGAYVLRLRKRGDGWYLAG